MDVRVRSRRAGMTTWCAASIIAIVLAGCMQVATPTGSPATAPPGGLGAPSNVRAALDDETVVLTWEPVDGAVGYTVWRDGQAVAEVSETRYEESAPGQPGNYLYQVEARIGAGIPGELSRSVLVKVGSAVPDST